MPLDNGQTHVSLIYSLPFAVSCPVAGQAAGDRADLNSLENGTELGGRIAASGIPRLNIDPIPSASERRISTKPP